MKVIRYSIDENDYENEESEAFRKLETSIEPEVLQNIEAVNRDDDFETNKTFFTSEIRPYDDESDEGIIAQSIDNEENIMQQNACEQELQKPEELIQEQKEEKQMQKRKRKTYQERLEVENEKIKEASRKKQEIEAKMKREEKAFQTRGRSLLGTVIEATIRDALVRNVLKNISCTRSWFREQARLLPEKDRADYLAFLETIEGWAE